MNDIVEKLKSWDRCYPGNINIEEAVDEAAAEITRLREENEKLREALQRATDRDEDRRKPIRLVGSEAADKIYVVIEEDRGLGFMVLAGFKSEEEAIVFAKKHSRCEVQSADILD